MFTSEKRDVPWRTLTGRQHFYLDHEGYLAFGEHLPTYKPQPDARMIGDHSAGSCWNRPPRL